MTAPSPTLFDEVEWEGIVSRLREVPGSVTAAIVLRPAPGDALIDALARELATLLIEVAPPEATAPEIGWRAQQLGETPEGGVLVLLLDGRRSFDSEAAIGEFYRALNFQRERLASGLVRTLLVLNDRAYAELLRWAPDLRDWVRVFHFEGTDVPVPDELELGQRPASASSGGFNAREFDLEALHDQLARARASGDPLAWQVAATLFVGLATRGDARETRRVWNDELGGDAGVDRLSGPVLVNVLHARAQLARRDGDLAGWESWNARLESAARELGDDRATALAATSRSDLLVARGKMDDALLVLREEVLPAFVRLQDDFQRAVTMGRIADIHFRRGELDEALRIRREEELPVYERLGDVHARSVATDGIADILVARGRLDEALRVRREELEVRERQGDLHGRAILLSGIADIHEAQGGFDEALRIRREEVLPYFENAGDVRERAVTMGGIVNALRYRGDLAEAKRRLRDLIPVFERLGDARELMVARINLAQLLVDKDPQANDAEARELLGLAIEAAERLRIPEAVRRTVELLEQLPTSPGGRRETENRQAHEQGKRKRGPRKRTNR